MKQIVLIFLKHLQLLNDLRCHNQAKPETYLPRRTPSMSMISQALSRMMPPLLDLTAQTSEPAHRPPSIPLHRPEDPAGRGHGHGQARDLFSTETLQAAGPSRPTSPFAALPSHVNRFDSDDNLVNEGGKIIDMNAADSRSLMKTSNKATTSSSTCQHQREGW